MHPVHDVDAILILSLSVVAKRRPADLVEIVTATSLTQGTIPAAPLLSDSFARLSACGLIVGIDGGYTLSADAQEMLASRRKKDDNEKMLSGIMEHLTKYQCKAAHLSIHVSEEQLLVAVKTSRAASNGPVRSLLASKPKPKPVWISKKDLVQGRQQFPASKRRKP
jgi:hypothetical protein